MDQGRDYDYGRMQGSYPKNNGRDAKRVPMHPPVGVPQNDGMHAPAPRAARGLDLNMLDMGLYDAAERRLPRGMDMVDDMERRRGRETPPPAMMFQEVMLR